MDKEEIKEMLIEGTLSDKLEAMDYLDILFDSYDQDIPQLKEIIEYLIHFAMNVQDDKMRKEILYLICKADTKKDFIKVDFYELEQGLTNVPIKQLPICIEILGYSRNKKYIKTLFKYRNHEDKDVRLSVEAALSELGYEWTGLYARRISKHKKSKSSMEIRKEMSMDDYYSKNPVLLYIGKKIVEDVLDKANEDYMTLISNASYNSALSDKLKSFSQEQINLILELIPWITSGTICNTLYLFDQNEDMQIIVEYEGKKINLAEVSDWINGELLVEGGWLDRFGKYMDFMTIDRRK